MSWFRISHSPATLLSRFQRRFLLPGVLVRRGCGGGGGAAARARVSKEDRCSIASSTGIAGGHRRSSLPIARSKYSMPVLLMENVLLVCTAIWSKFLPLHNNFRSIMTWVSVDEREVKALDLFLSAVNDAAFPTNDICRLYLESLSRSNNLSTAAYLLSYLHDREIHLPLNTYNILLAAAIEASDFQLFSEIFKNLLLSYQPPDFSSYVNVAKAFHKLADSDQLVKFIMEVSEITVHRDPSVINRIIFVTAKSGQIDKSLMIYEELKNLGRKMDTVTFNTVLAMLGRAGRVDQMLSEFILMKDLGYIPDIVTYNTLINCLRRLGRLELCKTFTKEMLERGIKLDLRTYTALIDGFGRAGHVKDALRLFDELKSSHRPSIYVYRALISDLKKAGKFDLALNLLDEMNSDASNLIGPSDFRQKTRKRNNRVERDAFSWELFEVYHELHFRCLGGCSLSLDLKSSVLHSHNLIWEPHSRRSELKVI